MLPYLSEIQVKVFLFVCFFNAVVHTETENSHSDETDQGQNNHSRGAKGEEQISAEERQTMMQESVQMQVLNKRKG